KPGGDKPFEDKESFKWVRGVRAAAAAVAALPDAERPRLIHVMDREGDIHEVLEAIAGSPHGAVIRSAQNRSVAGGIGKAPAAVAAAAVIGTHPLPVPPRAGRAGRTARLELRAVTL